MDAFLHENGSFDAYVSNLCQKPNRMNFSAEISANKKRKTDQNDYYIQKQSSSNNHDIQKIVQSNGSVFPEKMVNFANPVDLNWRKNAYPTFPLISSHQISSIVQSSTSESYSVQSTIQNGISNSSITFSHQKGQNNSTTVSSTKSSRNNVNDGDYAIVVGEYLNSMSEAYEVLAFLGRGTFGQVVKCVSKSNNRLVAIKILKNHPSYLRQGNVEIQILQTLSQQDTEAHNIVRAIECFQHKNHMCLVFELLEQNLYEYLKSNKFRPLSLREIRPITQQVLVALSQLRTLGLIHADLKPENIMLVHPAGEGGMRYRVKVIDFGSACYSSKTIQNTYLQSRYYRAPEILLGLPFNEAIDMWSLGCVIAELFLGWPLYPGSSEYDQMRYIVETQGLPPVDMIKHAGKGSRFFTKDQYLQEWRLKNQEEYLIESGQSAKEARKYIFSSLDQIREIGSIPMMGSPDYELEVEDRRHFAHLLTHMLRMRPLERIVPDIALNHPFITMTHMQSNSFVKRAYESMALMQVCYEKRASNPLKNVPIPKTLHNTPTSISTSNNYSSRRSCINHNAQNSQNQRANSNLFNQTNLGLNKNSHASNVINNNSLSSFYELMAAGGNALSLLAAASDSKTLSENTAGYSHNVVKQPIHMQNSMHKYYQQHAQSHNLNDYNKSKLNGLMRAEYSNQTSRNNNSLISHEFQGGSNINSNGVNRKSMIPSPMTSAMFAALLQQQQQNQPEVPSQVNGTTLNNELLQAQYLSMQHNQCYSQNNINKVSNYINQSSNLSSNTGFQHKSNKTNVIPQQLSSNNAFPLTESVMSGVHSQNGASINGQQTSPSTIAAVALHQIMFSSNTASSMAANLALANQLLMQQQNSTTETAGSAGVSSTVRSSIGSLSASPCNRFDMRQSSSTLCLCGDRFVMQGDRNSSVVSDEQSALAHKMRCALVEYQQHYGASNDASSSSNHSMHQSLHDPVLAAAAASCMLRQASCGANGSLPGACAPKPLQRHLGATSQHSQVAQQYGNPSHPVVGQQPQTCNTQFINPSKGVPSSSQLKQKQQQSLSAANIHRAAAKIDGHPSSFGSHSSVPVASASSDTTNSFDSTTLNSLAVQSLINVAAVAANFKLPEAVDPATTSKDATSWNNIAGGSSQQNFSTDKDHLERITSLKEERSDESHHRFAVPKPIEPLGHSKSKSQTIYPASGRTSGCLNHSNGDLVFSEMNVKSRTSELSCSAGQISATIEKVESEERAEDKMFLDGRVIGSSTSNSRGSDKKIPVGRVQPIIKEEAQVSSVYNGNPYHHQQTSSSNAVDSTTINHTNHQKNIPSGVLEARSPRNQALVAATNLVLMQLRQQQTYPPHTWTGDVSDHSTHEASSDSLSAADVIAAAHLMNKANSGKPMPNSGLDVNGNVHTSSVLPQGSTASSVNQSGSSSSGLIDSSSSDRKFQSLDTYQST